MFAVTGIDSFLKITCVDFWNTMPIDVQDMKFDKCYETLEFMVHTLEKKIKLSHKI